MKFFLAGMITMMIILSISFSCSTEKQSDNQVKSEMKMKGNLNIAPEMLATTTDLSCGMDMSKHTIADTAIYKGQVYGFCSAYCKDKFKEDPEASLARLESNHAETKNH